MTVNTDTELYRALCAANPSTEGNLLEHSNVSDVQLDFIFKHVGDARVILETGTNKCLFAYALTEHFKRRFIFYSFDIDENARRCALKFNEYMPFDSNVMIFTGDTKRTFPKMVDIELYDYDDEERIEFDLAWIDGGHEYDTALNDITCSMKLQIPKILVDDTSGAQVANAVRDALSQFPEYRLTDTSSDNRRIVCLERA